MRPPRPPLIPNIQVLLQLYHDMTAHSKGLVMKRGLVCAPRFPSRISRNRSDSDQIPIGNSGTQDHPNSREFVQFVRPDSDRKGQFRSDHSEPSPTNFRPISGRNQLVPIGKTVRTVINH